jgi:hypothetical protein
MSRRIPLIARLVLSVLLFSFIAAPHAHAYIDPGSSSMLIQIILGAAAGVGLAIATFWNRLRTFFGRKKTDDTTSETETTPDEPAAPPQDTTP